MACRLHAPAREIRNEWRRVVLLDRMVAVDVGAESGPAALVGSWLVPGWSVAFVVSSRAVFYRDVQLLDVSVTLVATGLPVVSVAA